MNALRGWLAALGSVLLASAAQLGMRWGMSRLPLPEAWAGQTPERAALLAVALAVGGAPPRPARHALGHEPPAAA
ncbi:hypothetical protein ACSEVT_07625 [Pseudomonas aeruginosa]